MLSQKMNGSSAFISPFEKLNFLEKLFDPRNSLTVFLFAIGLAYCVIPVGINVFVQQDKYFHRLSMITALCMVAVYLGSRISILDSCFRKSAPRLVISTKIFVGIIWLIFISFFIVTISTAQTIPFFSALAGTNTDDLSQQRGDFLKGREGFGIILLYISSFMNTIIPYSIVILYHERSKFRHFASFVFFAYAVSFMVKALFLNMIFPILAYLAIKKNLRGKTFLYLFTGSVFVLVGMVFISLQGHTGIDNPGNFFSALYVPSDPLIYLLWRSIGVPVFTAADTLLVHEELFGGHPLMGATSTFIAGIAGLERINLERHVFEYQFGNWNEIANANAVFIVDAFVNFGWFGVLLFGCFVGQIFRWFSLSFDVAFKAQWVIFAFLLFSSPIIGMLLSNGWAYMIFHVLFIRVRSHAKKYPS